MLHLFSPEISRGLAGNDLAPRSNAQRRHRFYHNNGCIQRTPDLQCTAGRLSSQIAIARDRWSERQLAVLPKSDPSRQLICSVRGLKFHGLQTQAWTVQSKISLAATPTRDAGSQCARLNAGRHIPPTKLDAA